MNIGLLGFGTVGSGFYELSSLSSFVTVTHILSRQALDNVSCPVTANIDDIISDPDTDTVVELIGGLDAAYDYVMRSIKKGKNVVTANKFLISERMKEIYNAAEEYGVKVRFTAAAGGGIPWLTSLSRASGVDRILSIGGIMNGTSNHILSEMSKKQLSYEEALKDAQAKGYAESDPSADVLGIDTCRKLAISAFISFDKVFNVKDIPTFGITNVTRADISKARSEGYTVKLYASSALETDGSFSSFVCPTLFPVDSFEAETDGAKNIFSFKAENLGVQSFYGEGAGGGPTALNVLSDCIDILSGAENYYGKKPLYTGKVNNGSRQLKWIIRQGDKYRSFRASPDEAFKEYKSALYRDGGRALIARVFEQE